MSGPSLGWILPLKIWSNSPACSAASIRWLIWVKTSSGTFIHRHPKESLFHVCRRDLPPDGQKTLFLKLRVHDPDILVGFALRHTKELLKVLRTVYLFYHFRTPSFLLRRRNVSFTDHSPPACQSSVSIISVTSTPRASAILPAVMGVTNL